MNIEIQAVNAASQHFGWVETLEPQFETHDKVINTDGVIQIYSTSGRDKPSHIGHANVQVKGVRWAKQFRDFASRSVPVVDLKGYLNERGLILIVAHVNMKTRRTALYYITLHPFKILDFLTKFSNQQSVTLHLKPLPEDAEALIEIAKFSHIAQQEDPNNYQKPFKIDDRHTLQIVSSRKLQLHKPLSLDRAEGDMDFTVFLTDSDGIRTPIDGSFQLIPSDYMDHPTDTSIGSSSVIYENVTKRRIDTDTFRVTLSGNLYITLTSKADSIDVSVTVSSGGTVQQFAKDLAFYVDCLDEGSIWIDGVEKHFNTLDEATAMREQKYAIDRILETLDLLNVDPDLIHVDDLTDKVQRELETVRGSLLEHEEIDPSVPTSGRIAVPIGGYRIELLLELVESTRKWIIHNPYDIGFAKSYYFYKPLEDDDEAGSADEDNSIADGSIQIVSPFDVLEVEDIIVTLNLNLDKVVEIYSKIPDSSSPLSFANNFLLNLLLASDRSEKRQAEFLKAASELSHWIMAKSDEPDPVFQVNAWQVKARMDGLESGDLTEIRGVRRNVDRGHGPTNQQLGYCCSILLGELDDAAFRKEEMSPEMRHLVETWPITALITRA